jgi:hypothetical protein
MSGGESGPMAVVNAAQHNLLTGTPDNGYSRGNFEMNLPSTSG